MITGIEVENDLYYQATISSLAEGEEVLWAGKPELKCYQKRKRHEYVMLSIFFQALLLPVIIGTLLTIHQAHAKGILVEVIVIDLTGTAVIASLAFSPRKTADAQYTITSSNLRYAFLSDGKILTRRIGWEQIKSIKVREVGCGLLTVTINPYFLTGKEPCNLRCLSHGDDVLAIITTYRPDIYNNLHFS